MSESDEESSSNESDSSISSSSDASRSSSSSSSSSSNTNESTSHNDTKANDKDDTSRKSSSNSSMNLPDDSGSSNSSDDEETGESGWSSSSTSSEEERSSEGEKSKNGDAQSVVSSAMSVESAAFSVIEMRDVPWMDVSNTPRPLVQTALPDASDDSESPNPSSPKDSSRGSITNTAATEKRSPKKTKPKRKTKHVASRAAAAPTGTDELRREKQRSKKAAAPPASSRVAPAVSSKPSSALREKSVKPKAKPRKVPVPTGGTPKRKQRKVASSSTKVEKQSSKVGISAQGGDSKPISAVSKKTKLRRPKPTDHVAGTTTQNSTAEAERRTSNTDVKTRQKMPPNESSTQRAATCPSIVHCSREHKHAANDDGTDSGNGSSKINSSDDSEHRNCASPVPEKHLPSEIHDDFELEPTNGFVPEHPIQNWQPVSENISSFYGLPDENREDHAREETAPRKAPRQKDKNDTKTSPDDDIRRRRKTGFVIAAAFTTVVFSFVFAMAMMIGSSSSTSDQSNGPKPMSAAELPLCNGVSNLCKVRLDDQLFSIVDAERSSTSRMRRLYSIDSNLASGYRGFRLSLSWCETVLQVGDCGSGQSVIPVLEGLMSFLASNRRDFVLLLIERSDEVTMDDVANLLWSIRGLTENMYVYPGNSSPWPLLETVLDHGKQLLLFENTALRSLCVTCPAGVHSWQEFTATTNLPLEDGTLAQAANCELTGNPKDFIAIYGPNACDQDDEVNTLSVHFQACASKGYFANFLFAQSPCQSVLDLVADENSSKDATVVSWFPLQLQLGGLQSELDELEQALFERSCRLFFSENVSRGTNMDCMIESQLEVGSSTNIRVRISTDSPISGQGLEVITLTDTLDLYSSDFVASLRASFASELISIKVIDEWVTPSPSAVTTNPPTSEPSLSPSSGGVAVRLPESFTESPVLPGSVRLPDGLF